MPKKITLGNSKQIIQLEKKPFAAGGEGELFRIVSPSAYRQLVVKLYFKDKRTEKQATKIEYLIQNPPDIVNQSGHQSIIWAKDSVQEDGQFAGFMMPFAEGAKLEILCTQKLPKRYRNKWKKFDLNSPEAGKLRLKVCFNIAAAVYQIHRTQKYVLVDLKPDNILINPNGLISIVDIDSVQVTENGEMRYPARVATPEFSPPEYFNEEAKPGKHTIFETWDRFSLAVIFYKMLFGIHPYAGTGKPPFDKFVNLQDKIKHGQFVHSPAKKHNFAVIPPPHQVFYKLPIHIQNLFVRCFDYGHKNTYDRPSANEWCWGMTPRPPLINLRKLPSSQLPMKAINYTIPLSLSPLNASMQMPALSHQPPSQVRFIKLDTDFKTVRIGILLTLVFMLFWIFGRNMPITWITFFQVISIGLTGSLVTVIDYYSLNIVKEKNQIQEAKTKFAKAKRILRKTVNKLIRESQNVPVTEQDLQNKFYFEQKNVLQKEQVLIDEKVSRYHRLMADLDRDVLDLNQKELEKVKTLEKELIKDVDLSLVEEASFLPLEGKVRWIEKRLNEGIEDKNYQNSLENLKEQLIVANEKFEKQKDEISKTFDKGHNSAKDVCEKAYNKLILEIEEITTITEKAKDELFKKILPKQEDAIRNTNDTVNEMKEHLYELEDLYQNFNSVSDKLLEYKHINFIEYLKQGLLFHKPKI
jgi:serine/threonine protein kinase